MRTADLNGFIAAFPQQHYYDFGWGWVFAWNVRPQQMTQGTSNTILAYEKDADDRGMRVVLMGDGSVDVIDEGLFKVEIEPAGDRLGHVPGHIVGAIG